MASSDNERSIYKVSESLDKAYDAWEKNRARQLAIFAEPIPVAPAPTPTFFSRIRNITQDSSEFNSLSTLESSRRASDDDMSDVFPRGTSCSISPKALSSFARGKTVATGNELLTIAIYELLVEATGFGPSSVSKPICRPILKSFPKVSTSKSRVGEWMLSRSPRLFFDYSVNSTLTVNLQTSPKPPPSIPATLSPEVELLDVLQTLAVRHPLDKFTCFQSLPPKVRLKIWKFALPTPRLVFCEDFKYKIPSICRVNKESRAVALAQYQLQQPILGASKNVYMDLQSDTFYYAVKRNAPEVLPSHITPEQVSPEMKKQLARVDDSDIFIATLNISMKLVSTASNIAMSSDIWNVLLSPPHHLEFLFPVSPKMLLGEVLDELFNNPALKTVTVVWAGIEEGLGKGITAEDMDAELEFVEGPRMVDLEVEKMAMEQLFEWKHLENGWKFTGIIRYGSFRPKK